MIGDGATPGQHFDAIRRPALTPASDQPTYRRDDIQGMRAVAVIAVVLFHAGLPVAGGYLGVDMFFVISGFVIAGLIHRQMQARKFHVRQFFARRIRRLVPALAFVSVTVLVLSIFFLSPIDGQRDTAALAAGGATFSANFVMMIAYGGYFDPQTQFSPLMHLWSLSIEEQFYMLFPFALIIGTWWRGLRGAIMAIAVFSLISVTAALADWVPSPIAPFVKIEAYDFFSPVTRSWEFAVGALALLLVKHRVWSPSAPGSMGLGIAGGLTLCFVFLGSTLLPSADLATILAVAGTLVLLLAGVTSDDRAPVGITHALGRPIAVWIGGLSYSWYLWHWPAAVFTRSMEGGPALVAIFTLMSIIPAYVAFRLVEEPIRSGRRLAKVNSVTLLLSCSVTTVALAAMVYLGANHNWWSANIALVRNQVEPWFLGYENGCAKGLPPTPENIEFCTWNQSAVGAPIYLIGDSNAGMYGDGLLIAATEMGRPLTIISTPGCDLGEVGYFDAGLKSESQTPECVQQGRDVIEWLRSAKPGTVLTASGRSDSGLPTPSEGGGDPIDQFAQALAAPLGEIRSAGHQVVLIRTMPSLSRQSDGIWWHANECPAVQLATNPEACGVSETLDVLSPKFDTVWQAQERAAQITGAEYMDLLPDICPNRMCTTNIADSWLRRDGTHLSVQFSRNLAQRFVSIITRQSDTASA